MKNPSTTLRRFVNDEEGATMVEYGLLVALIAVVAFGLIAAVGLYVQGAFNAVEDEMHTRGMPKSGAVD